MLAVFAVVEDPDLLSRPSVGRLGRRDLDTSLRGFRTGSEVVGLSRL
jgi:hypothetical protein